MNRLILGPRAGRWLATLLGLAPASALAIGHHRVAVAPAAVGYAYAVPAASSFVVSPAAVQPLAVVPAAAGLCQRAQAQVVAPAALTYAVPTMYAVSAAPCGAAATSAYALLPVAAQVPLAVAPATGYSLLVPQASTFGPGARSVGAQAAATPYLNQIGVSPDLINQLNGLIRNIVQTSLTSLNNGSLSRDALVSDLRTRALSLLEAYLGNKINPTDPNLLADLGRLIDSALGGSGITNGGAGGSGGLTINTPQVNIIINTSGTPTINPNPTAPGGGDGGIIQDPSRAGPK